MYHNKESEYATAHVLPVMRKDVAGEKGSVDISRRCCSYSFVCSLLTAMARGDGHGNHSACWIATPVSFVARRYRRSPDP